MADTENTVEDDTPAQKRGRTKNPSKGKNGASFKPWDPRRPEDIENEYGHHEDFVTEDQEAFCAEFVKTGSANYAYKHVFPGLSNHSYSGNWIRRPSIRKRITELQQKLQRTSMLTLQEHLDELASLRDEARAAGRFSAAITAEISRGRAAGLYVQRTEISVANLESLSAQELEQKLLEIEKQQSNDLRLLSHIDGTAETVERDAEEEES